MSSISKMSVVRYLLRKGVGSAAPDVVDEIVGERLRGDVEHLGTGMAAQNMVSDSVEEMGLAQTDAAVEKERIVGPGRCVGDRPCCGVRELAVLADDELPEGVAGMETRIR